MVNTEVDPIDLDVPCDRDSSFEPKTAKKRQRRLGGVDSMVIYLTKTIESELTPRSEEPSKE